MRVAHAVVSEHILQWMIEPQFVELDIFLGAFERGVAGELFEAGDVHTLGDPARDRPAPEAVAGKISRVKPGEAGPVLDDQRDRNRCRSGWYQPGSGRLPAFSVCPAEHAVAGARSAGTAGLR